ncbi:MAG: enoyl-CoA hydratase [Hyphomicrobiales bacterium]
MLKTELSNQGILTLTMASPPANTLSERMLEALSSAIKGAGDEVRVIILQAEGRLFCAGHDLKELTARRSDDDRGQAYFTNIMQECADLMQAIVGSPKPIIAKVDGLATAAGCQLVASCDLAVASDRAAFCTPGVNIGLFCSTPMVALSRNVSRKQAMEMLLLGEQISAGKALEFGLVNKVVEPNFLDDAVEEMAEIIASKSSYVLKVGKQAFYQQAAMPLQDAYSHCADVMVQNMLSRDAQEGIGAVLEKRTPSWEDK